MLNSETRQFILPFLAKESSDPEIEAAAVFAYVELERNKGGGLISKQPQERLVSLSKLGYPIWLLPRIDIVLIIDGLADSSNSVSYIEVHSAGAFMENLETNSNTRENYTRFLLEYNNFFQQSISNREFLLKGLISDLDFKREISVYLKEATKIEPNKNETLIMPTLEESVNSVEQVNFDRVRSFQMEEVEKLSECIRRINKITRQYITELEYEALAIKEETNAKNKAQEELISPKIAKIKKEYKQKLKKISDSYDIDLEELQKTKAKLSRFIEKNTGKIKIYKHKAKAQAIKKHAVYEKRWKDKIKKTQKELHDLKKELEKIETNIKRQNKQKAEETSKLNFDLDVEIKIARQPIMELEVACDAKLFAYQQEADVLLKKEKPIVEDITKNLKLREANIASFETLGFREPGLRGPSLFFVPFYVGCYEINSIRRYFILPPSIISSVNLSAKIKGIFGMSKIKGLLAPRFEAISSVVEKIQILIKQNSMFEDKLNVLSQKNNLLNNTSFLQNVSRGLGYLRNAGWLSENEQQYLIRLLTV